MNSYFRNPSAITVVHGTSDKTRYENHTIGVVEVFSHVNYNPRNTYIHDIALLRVSIIILCFLLYVVRNQNLQAKICLPEPNSAKQQIFFYKIITFQLSSPLNILPFSILPNQFDGISQGTPATLLGWGDTLETIRTDILQKVDLIVFSNQICSERHNRTIHQSNICGGVPEGGRGQCSVCFLKYFYGYYLYVKFR